MSEDHHRPGHDHTLIGLRLPAFRVGDDAPCIWATFIATGKGWLYLAAVLDLATRKIVGWSMRDHMRTELPLAALMMAAQRQRPVEDLICHSDRGSQYASEGVQQATHYNENQTINEPDGLLLR